MDIKDFGADAELVYSLKVFVNDQETITIEAYSEDGLLEQLHKVDHAISKEIEEQYANLADRIQDEETGELI